MTLLQTSNCGGDGGRTGLPCPPGRRKAKKTSAVAQVTISKDLMTKTSVSASRFTSGTKIA